MKQSFILLAFFLFSTASQSQIEHTSYGDGWSIPLNANVGLDVDEDGVVDFRINEYKDELGFTPLLSIGCLAIPSLSSYVSFGARALLVFEEGELINSIEDGLTTYVEEGRASTWHRDEGFAEGWNDGEEKYIAFILLGGDLNQFDAKNGWMKIKIDVDNEALVILELAYIEGFDATIVVGDLGTTSAERLPIVEALALAPNPAIDLLNVSFEYLGTQALSAAVYNELGQKVIDLNTLGGKGSNSFQVDVKGLSIGSYYFVLSDGQTNETKRFTVIR